MLVPGLLHGACSRRFRQQLEFPAPDARVRGTDTWLEISSCSMNELWLENPKLVSRVRREWSVACIFLKKAKLWLVWERWDQLEVPESDMEQRHVNWFGESLRGSVSLRTTAERSGACSWERDRDRNGWMDGEKQRQSESLGVEVAKSERRGEGWRILYIIL